MRDESGAGGGASGLTPAQLIWWLIGINAAVFLLPSITGWGFEGENRAGGYSSRALLRGEIWTLFTYQFVHKNILHIALNMLGLYFLGRHVARAIGNGSFLVLYLVGGVVGALFESVLKGIVGEHSAMVGASGSVSAVIAMFVALMPQAQLQIFPLPFLIRARVLLWAFLIFNGLLGLLTIKAAGPQTAYLTHVGGALFGLLFVRLRAHPIKWPAFRSRKTKASPVRYETRPENSKIIDAQFTEENADYNSVLDKINREGIGSLTPHERKILEQASEKLSRDKR